MKTNKYSLEDMDLNRWTCNKTFELIILKHNVGEGYISVYGKHNIHHYTYSRDKKMFIYRTETGSVLDKILTIEETFDSLTKIENIELIEVLHDNLRRAINFLK